MFHDIDLCEIFECAHLKFMVSVWSKHRYTHVHNAVMLVWGLLRFTPIWVHRFLESCLLIKACTLGESNLSAVAVHIRLQEAHHQFTERTQILFGHLLVSQGKRVA